MSDIASTVLNGVRTTGEGMPEHRHDEPSAPSTCPAWCRRRHAPDDHPGDRLHQSPPEYAALVTSPRSDEPYAATVAVSAVGRLVQRIGSREVWVEVTGEEGREVRIVVTTESARRLLTVLEALLALPPS
jgi:hypothetical protein